MKNFYDFYLITSLHDYFIFVLFLHFISICKLTVIDYSYQQCTVFVKCLTNDSFTFMFASWLESLWHYVPIIWSRHIHTNLHTFLSSLDNPWEVRNLFVKNITKQNCRTIFAIECNKKGEYQSFLVLSGTEILFCSCLWEKNNKMVFPYTLFFH